MYMIIFFVYLLVHLLQYSPHNDNLFVAAYESGVCQVMHRKA